MGDERRRDGMYALQHMRVALKSIVRVCRTIDYDQDSSFMREKMVMHPSLFFSSLNPAYMRLVFGILSGVVLVKPIASKRRAQSWHFQVLQLAPTYLRCPGIIYPPVRKDTHTAQFQTFSPVHRTASQLRPPLPTSAYPQNTTPDNENIPVPSRTACYLPTLLGRPSTSINKTVSSKTRVSMEVRRKRDGDVFLEIEARREKVCKGKDLVMEREPDMVFARRMYEESEERASTVANPRGDLMLGDSRGEYLENGTWSDRRREERAALNEILRGPRLAPHLNPWLEIPPSFLSELFPADVPSHITESSDSAPTLEGARSWETRRRVVEGALY
ncbi:hypothetical protein EDD18DRAFT_1110028 [Armillaria luteobubalina]|uniref:Uncharacterized protein n=1 Tax=Armillaria luteobubalina TaxID=153913 RepID=A0AA39UJ11_9AGAR|nr:hypothetical protein EDD18DRAFT_1110028 [Armillaria luteobubalina]